MADPVVLPETYPPLHPSIGIAVLAAGQGTRFGADKRKALLMGRPLLHWTMRAAERAGFSTRVLVLRPGEAPPRSGWQGVANPDADSGIASSLRAAAAALLVRGCRRAVIALGDMPAVAPAHLRGLALADGVVFTRHPDGRRGAPAAFTYADLPRFADLAGNQGAAALPWPGAGELNSTDTRSLMDVDDPASLALLAAGGFGPFDDETV